MLEPPDALFSFAEPDHLIRIHVRLELEDAGFAVEEDGVALSIVPDDGRARPADVPSPTRGSRASEAAGPPQ